MAERRREGWSPGRLGTIVVLSLATVSGGEKTAAQAPDPRQAMTSALAASGPHPSLGEEARVFDRFVGTWDCDYTFIAEDGATRQATGELKFGWILDGRALQDIWISYPKKGEKERRIGTSVRFFDNKSKTWRVLFASPAFGALITVQGGVQGDKVVLRGVDDKGTALRWSFNDIQANSFTWRGESSRDGGKTWRLEEEHHMRRRRDSQKKPHYEARSNDSTHMIKSLRASGPHASLGARAQLFDRFVGTWDLDCVFYSKEGKTNRFRGAWMFDWVLDGLVVQDVLIEGDKESGRKLGTTIRFYDAAASQWRIVWIPPLSGNVIALRGGAAGDRIVLLGDDVDGSKLRWSFNDIKVDSFLWRGETSADGGRTWRIEQEMHLKRRSPNSSGQVPQTVQSARDLDTRNPQTGQSAVQSALIGGSVAPAEEKSKSAVAFEQLTSLVGEWRGEKDGAEIKLTYTLTAAGSALMEEFRPSKGPVMITMFTIDGDRLIATHYCSVGNQPHMATEAIMQPQVRRLAFSLTRVTGMKTPNDWHNTGLLMVFEDKKHLTQEWTYEFKGETGKTVFHFTRER